MRISIRTLTGEAAELDLAPTTTVAQLRVQVEDALNIPASEQRFVYAGTQLEEEVTPAWRARRNRGGSKDFSAALGVAGLVDGTPLTLEHHGLQKGSVINVVRKAITSSVVTSGAAVAAPDVGRMSPAVDSPEKKASPLGGQAVQAPAVGPAVASGFQVPVSSNAAAPLIKALEALGDQELFSVMLPVLQQRPAVRAALLAEDQTQTPAQRSHVEASRVQNAAPASVPAAGSRGMPFPVQSGFAVLPRYARGDPVSVYSNSAQRWFPGEVVQVAAASANQIPEGSVEVVFELGRKWVAPGDLPRSLAKR